MLKGKSIILKQIEEGDLEKFRDWRNSPYIRKYVREYRPLNMENQKRWFRSLTLDRNNIEFAIKDVLEDKTIGLCGLTYINWKEGCGEVSIYIGDIDWQGKGYAGEALDLILDYGFMELRLHRIYAVIYGYNEASIKLFEKHGFKFEGKHREARFWDGKYYDELVYGILDYEYKEVIKNDNYI